MLTVSASVNDDDDEPGLVTKSQRNYKLDRKYNRCVIRGEFRQLHLFSNQWTETLLHSLFDNNNNNDDDKRLNSEIQILAALAISLIKKWE